MATKKPAGGDDEGYRPETYVRGDVAGFAKTDEEEETPGEWGVTGNKSAYSIEATLTDGRTMMVCYGGWAGHPVMNREATVIQIPIQGAVEQVSDSWVDGHQQPQLLVIAGEKLKSVFTKLCRNLLGSIHPGLKLGATVNRVEIRELRFGPPVEERDA